MVSCVREQKGYYSIIDPKEIIVGGWKKALYKSHGSIC